MTTEDSKPKAPKIRANSRMALIVEQFNSGNKEIEGIAIKLQEAEESGKITGLKKTSDEFKATKNLIFYKKVVNWYLNQAKHKKLIDAPIVARKSKVKKEELVTAEVIAQAESAVSSSESTSEAGVIPSI